MDADAQKDLIRRRLLGRGLALVKVIGARHGLEVRLEDAGPGARFVVEQGAGR